MRCEKKVEIRKFYSQPLMQSRTCCSKERFGALVTRTSRYKQQNSKLCGTGLLFLTCNANSVTERNEYKTRHPTLHRRLTELSEREPLSSERWTDDNEH